METKLEIVFIKPSLLWWDIKDLLRGFRHKRKLSQWFCVQIGDPILIHLWFVQIYWHRGW